jgi:hypothetical protein
LPSLDRLAGLIERVVELVDEVAGGPAEAPEAAPQRAADAAPEHAPAPPAAVPAAVDGRGWLAFVPSANGYTLVPQAGSAPVPGEAFELEGVAFRVLRHAPSPLPGDHRRCVVVEREEPPESDRSIGE